MKSRCWKCHLNFSEHFNNLIELKMVQKKKKLITPARWKHSIGFFQQLKLFNLIKSNVVNKFYLFSIRYQFIPAEIVTLVKFDFFLKPKKNFLRVNKQFSVFFFFKFLQAPHYQYYLVPPSSFCSVTYSTSTVNNKLTVSYVVIDGGGLDAMTDQFHGRLPYNRDCAWYPLSCLWVLYNVETLDKPWSCYTSPVTRNRHLIN